MKNLLHTGRPNADLTAAASAIGILIQYHSFIETKAIAAEIVWDGIEWIFFTSPEGVAHFKGWDSIPAHVRIGALGSGTASHLPLDKAVSYVGDGRSTEDIAIDFAQIAGRAAVLFPRAKQSVRTIQRGLPASQVRELICYETLPRAWSVGPFQIYYFTSPSQVAGFFLKNTLAKGSLVVAIGQTTAAALREKGCDDVLVAGGYTSADLMDTIKAHQNG